MKQHTSLLILLLFAMILFPIDVLSQNGNNARVSQVGTLNMANLSQTGDANQHAAVQYGKSNEIEVDVNGSSNNGSHVQVGQLNMLSVVSKKLFCVPVW